ncbi:AraC family transcriptional regulator [Thioclava pacifica]|nr:GyrI-like domain-containing protein [Thioclava pacifica]
MAFEIELTHLPSVRLAGLPHKGPYPTIGPIFQELAGLIPEPSWVEVEGAAMIGHDDPREVAPEELRSHACFLVGEGFAMFPPLEEIRYPAGNYAVMRVKGPYSLLPEAYRWLSEEWFPASGQRHRDLPAYEVYLNDPANTKPEDLLTEIRLPLKG